MILSVLLVLVLWRAMEVLLLMFAAVLVAALLRDSGAERSAGAWAWAGIWSLAPVLARCC